MNWDYRYCWLRDATFTLGALINAGYRDEAQRWRDWLLRAIAGSPGRMRIMYRVDGGRHLEEWSVDELPGYRHARPVRIGNAASTQLQVDVYGEVLDCSQLGAARRVLKSTPQQTEVEVRIVDHLAKVWNTPGSGIWESRSNPGTTLIPRSWHGLVLIASSATGSPGLAGRPSVETSLRPCARRSTMRFAVKAGTPGSARSPRTMATRPSMRACCLLPLVGFLPANDPRMAATISRD